MRLTVHNTIVDEVERKVVLHASSKAVTDVGEYGNEYMFSFWMTEDGKMGEDLEEIADSKCSVDFMTNLGALAATKGKD